MNLMTITNEFPTSAVSTVRADVEPAIEPRTVLHRDRLATPRMTNKRRFAPPQPPDSGGGLMKRPPGVTMSSLNSYFRVTDLDRTLHDAVEAGATVVVPRMEVPNVGWFAMFLDPDQIPVGVMELR